jgi:uncharacterized protein (TIGR00661 family)
LERNKRVLVAPLDWGLGHATRCVPIIRALLAHHCEVVIASSGEALSLLQMEFPELSTIELPGYQPVYPSYGSMVWKMAFQLPKFIKAIAKEHLEIEKAVNKLGIDVVIADNRYGCFSKQVKSVFITHQLSILMPEGYKWLERYVNRFNAEQIKQYAECWVPVPSLASPLLARLLNIHTSLLKVRPIGYLSRFESKPALKRYDILVICSGPEPQRTIFEQMMTEQLKNFSGTCLLVRGKPGNDIETASGSIIVRDFMGATELNAVIEASEIVIARSGYSTIMDLARLNKKAIFIPTPGQTEQEYLARQLMQGQVSYYMPQKHFDLVKALNESLRFTGFTNFENNDSVLKNAIVSIC